MKTKTLFALVLYTLALFLYCVEKRHDLAAAVYVFGGIERIK